MTEFMQSISWFVPWVLFILAVMWGTYKSSKLDECRRARNRYYEQRNGLSGELLRNMFPKERRKWVDKYPPVPRGFAPKYVEEVSDFTEAELFSIMCIQGRYLDDEPLLIDRNILESTPRAIRIPLGMCPIS
jgi:hypothetical protein